MAGFHELIPNVIKRRINQKRPLIKVCHPDRPPIEVTFAILDNAVNRAAWFLTEHLPSDEYFIWMSQSDARYLVWIIAAMKTGKVVVLPSLSNRVSANLRLFETVGARHMLYGPESSGTLEELIDKASPNVAARPGLSLEEILSPEPVPDFPFNNTYDEIKTKRFMGLHTSGTSEMTAILMHPDVPISPASITDVINQSGANSLICPAVPIENMLDYPPGLEAFSRLKHIGYVGGPINPVLGARVAKVTPHLYSLIGSTEGALMHMNYSPNSENWDAIRFVEVGQRMEEVLPGLYELVFPRTQTIDRLYSYFRSYPDLEHEYRTKDLFSPVPNQPGWWRFRGRTDNWVAMANGYKMDPTDFEAIMTAHPDVRGVIVGGAYRFRLCMLVELYDHLLPTTDEEAQAALDKLWPTIQEANKSSPKFGQIPRELVLFVRPGKPFLRAGKGTIQRQLTLQAYEDEIDALYERVENGILVSDLEPITSLTPEGLTPVLTQLFQQALDSHDIDADTDVFARGLDSNGVTLTVSRLKAALRSYGISEDILHGINISLLYSSTTTRSLANILSEYLSDGSNKVRSEDPDGGVSDMLAKYLAGSHHLGTPQSIILTGSTGSLGTYLLAALQAQPESRVRRIFCLNRATDAASKQAASLKSRGLPPAQVSSGRVVFLTVKDFGAPLLGLALKDYDVLLAETTTVIHNAWPVNFLLPLQSFEPSIAGLVNLLELAQKGARLPAVLFVSSISAAMGAARDVPEEVLPEPAELVLRQGYARSKYVGERILDSWALAGIANKRRAAVLRVGQVAGPVAAGGAWNPWEWFPSLVRSSKFLGILPESLGTSSRVEWVPVDELSKIILEVVDEVTRSDDDATSGKTKQRGAKVYNLVNPHAVPFSDLLPALQEKGIADKTVPLETWIEMLERSSYNQKSTAHDNPAVKLLDFYKSIVPHHGGGGGVKRNVNGETKNGSENSKGGEDDYTWRVNNTLHASPTARALKPVNTEWVKLWVDRWGF
ncbi:hypothetical protein Daesc_004679 [Daldinia eschscholtzii]|uniref:Thioester reductase (TE) domain-containing protein n=1 Tax=Daldinia eschscholtzii TaxID=292717 RepID=A0AAX6MRA9_9PEZI